MNNMLKFVAANAPFDVAQYTWVHVTRSEDRKSTRLNSSH